MTSKRDAEQLQGFHVKQRGGAGVLVGAGCHAAAQLDQRRDKREQRDDRREEDEEVEDVVGAKFVGARGVEDGLREGEERGVERVPVAVDDAGPVVRADQVGDVHVGHAVAVERVGAELHGQPGDGWKQQEIGQQGAAQGLRSHRMPLCVGGGIG